MRWPWPPRAATRSPPSGVANFAWCPPGELERCGKRLEDARHELQALLPPGHHAHALPDVSFARMALAQGEPAQAKAHLEQALRVYGDDEPGNPERIGALAM